MAEKRLSKSHTKRLKSMLTDLDRNEALWQKIHGDRKAGTYRSAKWRDAEALRAALALVAAPPAGEGSK